MSKRLPLLALCFAGCAAPVGQFNHTVTVASSDDGSAVNNAFVDVCDKATTELRVALPGAVDQTITDAILAANDRGVDVLVVTDVDRAADPGIAAMTEAGLFVQLGDGPLSYFDFATSLDIGWSSDQVILSSAFVEADHQYFAGASSAGSGLDGTSLVAFGHQEDIADDLWTEHVQLFGGTDATAMDSHSAPAKSIADYRWRYGTGTDAEIEMWLGPQERLTKRVIDATYSARESVWILTDDLANDGLAHALQEKAADGFDVKVVVGPHFGTSSSLLSRVLEDETPDVQKFRVDGDLIPTVVIIDGQPSTIAEGRAMFMTHDLYSAARSYRGSPIVSDQMVDGLMWQVDDWNSSRSDMFNQVQSVWQSHLDRAGAF